MLWGSWGQPHVSHFFITFIIASTTNPERRQASDDNVPGEKAKEEARALLTVCSFRIYLTYR